MSRLARRVLIGGAAGAISAFFLASALPGRMIAVVLGLVLGAAFGLALLPAREGYVDRLMSGAAMGISLWGLISVIGIPLLSGTMPEWGAAQMRTHLPALVGWIMYGASVSILIQGCDALVARIFGAEKEFSRPVKEAKHVLILGGGFGGMKTAERLEEELSDDPSVAITLVSDTNALLFTPMLAEVAGGSLEPNHISTPLRGSLHRTVVVRGTVEEINLELRVVKVTGRELAYDQLVLALGAVSNYLGLTNVERNSLDFKTLLDAIRIRNRVIEMFERADRESDPSARQSLMTFVIAGGGFAGVELAGAVNDFAHGILADYPNLDASELRTILVHARDRILPELSDSLGRYAQKRMEARGIQFRLNTRLTDAQPGIVVLGSETVRAETLVWTAGTTPNPLLKRLPVERDKRGAVIVDGTMAVRGHLGVWALGDCAAVVDERTRKACPPTAQFALREAEVLAYNIRQALEGRPARPFHFDSLGAMCVVGHQTACAELTLPFARSRSVRFSGLLAWFLWRTIYLTKLPGLERKTRVLIDWTIELFFPRDIVQTIDLQ